MPRTAAFRGTLFAVGANALLLALKSSATGLSDSLTIFSETLNSLSDVVASVVIVLCVRWAWKRPDANHPFGHRRAEPIAGLLVAIFAGILGFEVCKTAVTDLWEGVRPERIGPFPIIALWITVTLKIVMAVYFQRLGRRLNSPALRATAVDCRNDVLVSLQGLIAVWVANYRVPVLDTVAALLVGGYILYSAYRIGIENIDYLMGRAPDPERLERIRGAAAVVPGVEAVVDVKAHYVGTMIHVELIALVDGTLTTHESHEVSEAVQDAVESLATINRAFVHIEPTRIGDGRATG